MFVKFRIIGEVCYETGGNCDQHSWDINEEFGVDNLEKAIGIAEEIANKYLDRYSHCEDFGGEIELFRCYENSMKKVYAISLQAAIEPEEAIPAKYIPAVPAKHIPAVPAKPGHPARIVGRKIKS